MLLNAASKYTQILPKQSRILPRKSIVYGVNVDYRVYRIKTQATEDGKAIREGDKLRRITRYNGKVEDVRIRKNPDFKAFRLKSGF